MAVSCRQDADSLEVSIRQKPRHAVRDVFGIVTYLVLSAVLTMLLVNGSRALLCAALWFPLSVVSILVFVRSLTLDERISLSPDRFETWDVRFGRESAHRVESLDGRVFDAPDRPPFFTLRGATPMLRLTDSRFMWGVGRMSFEEAQELAAHLNEYLGRASLTSASS